MAYTKQTWETGDTITAEKLNHIEDGIASGGGDTDTFKITGITNQQTGELSLNKTYSEIIEAVESGKLAYIEEGSDNMRFYFSHRAIAGDESYEMLCFDFVNISDIALGTMSLGSVKVLNNNTVTMDYASVSVTPEN